MEAALGQESTAAASLAQQAAQQQVPAHQPALPLHRHASGASGLPPRGPSFHSARSASATLDAAFAAVASGSEDGGGGGGGGMRHAYSTTSAPAFLAGAEAEAGDRPSAAASTGTATATPDNVSVAGSDAGGAGGVPVLPAWQSPARIAPVPASSVPPLPLSRLAHSGSGRQLAEDAGPGDLDLLPTPSAAPAGLQPALPQPALGSARWVPGPGGVVAVQAGGGSSSGASSVAASAVDGSQRAEEVPAPGVAAAAAAAAQQPPTLPSGGATSGGASSARRPSGLVPLDLAEGLTFETFGLESPDTITPGLQYARQVAQLFVEGRRCAAGALRVV